MKRVCNILSTFLLIILAILASALLIPKLVGYQEMAVLSGSMEPEYPVGSLVYVKKVPVDTLAAGDVITYRVTEDTVVTHRLVEIDMTAQTVVTKGDANGSDDGTPIAFSKIIGKAFAVVPYLGYLCINIKTPKGIIAVCAVLIVIIILAFLPDILADDEEEKTEKKKCK